MDYEKLESDIVLLLNPVDEDGNQLNQMYTAAPLPDNESEVIKTFTKPRVWISAGNSEYAESDSTDKIIQKETVSFEITIRAASRRGESGVLNIMLDIRRRLLGYRFPGCTRIQIRKSGWSDGTQNDWIYGMLFDFVTTVIDIQPVQTGPPAKDIDFN
ncbi:Gp37 family protein [Dysgonomonas sp.]